MGLVIISETVYLQSTFLPADTEVLEYTANVIRYRPREVAISSCLSVNCTCPGLLLMTTSTETGHYREA